VPAVPFGLVLKIAYQAAKGMHFLHSSGIVHRDLKSLNLLLDNKWNIKVCRHARTHARDARTLTVNACGAQVSDFGLTKFNEELKHAGKDHNMQGSVHWTAPEILNESAEIDYILSDVYSFGS
jgi:serine/threonine protein kinase